MAQAPQLPPPDKMIRELRSPTVSDLFYRELVDRNSPRWIENSPIKRGSIYSSLKGADRNLSDDEMPVLYFLRETTPIGSNTVAGMSQHLYVIWEWSSNPDAESAFNAEVSYLGDVITNPVYARRYLIRRDEYDAIPALPVQSTFTGLIGILIRDGGTNYTRAQAAFVGPGKDSGAKVEFVISDGVVMSAVILEEGTGFTTASSIQIIGDGQGADASILIQPAGAVLTSQKKVELPDGDPYAAEFVAVLRVYELLPGPYLPFTRYDDDLGPVQGRRRAVLNSGQLGGQITASTKINYESRDGSAVVLWEIHERWTTGSGVSDTDPETQPFPIRRWAEYKDERGSIKRTSQIVLQNPLHNEQATFVRNASSPNTTKTWYEPYEDNPFLWRKFVETWTEVSILYDTKTTGQFGGGVLKVQEIRGEPNSMTVDQGLLVTESTLKTISPNEQIKHTERLGEGNSSWPILTGVHTDEVTGIVVNYTKQVVPAGTGYPGRNPVCPDGRGPFVEITPLDKWRSIQIVSSVDLNTLPAPEAWNTTHSFFLPPTLLSIEAVWTNTQQRHTDAQEEYAEASVARSANGSMIIKSKAGFRGKANAIHTRLYRCGRPSPEQVPNPLRIYPSSGSIVFTGQRNSTRFRNQDDGGQILSDSYELSVHAVDVRDHLVGNFTVLNAEHPMLLPSAQATSGGGTQAAVFTFPLNTYMVVNIPMSTPTPEWLSSAIAGGGILYDVEVSEWRFGIWVIDAIFIQGAGYVPLA